MVSEVDIVEPVARAIHDARGICHSEDERMFEPYTWDECAAEEYPVEAEYSRSLARAAVAVMLAEIEALRRQVAGAERVLTDAGSEAVRMTLAAAMPGGSRTDRTKAQAFAQGVMHATASLAAAIRATPPVEGGPVMQDAGKP